VSRLRKWRLRSPARWYAFRTRGALKMPVDDALPQDLVDRLIATRRREAGV
jgi:hypothetical protein